MAISTCPKCGNKSFEVEDAQPKGAQHKLLFVQCSNCHSVIGVLDWVYIGNMLLLQNKAINQQNKALSEIANALKISVDLYDLPEDI